MKNDEKTSSQKPKSRPSTGRYLRCDRLRSGDVILFESSGMEGKLISTSTHIVGTDYWFSHAAIVLYKGVMLEAVDDGLMQTPLEICKAGDMGRTIVPLHDVSKYESVGVFRHPALENENEEKLTYRLLDFAQPLFFLEYPSRTTLARAASASFLGRAVATAGLWVMDKKGQLSKRNKEQPPVVPGPFCSMLVAILLNDLTPQNPLFAPPRDPADVNPNSLAAESCLRPVPGAVVGDMPDLINNPEFVDGFNGVTIPGYTNVESLAKTLQAHRDFNKQGVQIRRAIKEITDKAKSISRQQLEWLKRLRPSVNTDEIQKLMAEMENEE